MKAFAKVVVYINNKNIERPQVTRLLRESKIMPNCSLSDNKAKNVFFADSRGPVVKLEKKPPKFERKNENSAMKRQQHVKWTVGRGRKMKIFEIHQKVLSFVNKDPTKVTSSRWSVLTIRYHFITHWNSSLGNSHFFLVVAKLCAYCTFWWGFSSREKSVSLRNRQHE